MLLMLFSVNAFCAVDMFVKMEGVEGESTDTEHQGWIEILNYNYHEATPFEKNRKIIKKKTCPELSEISFVKKVDSSSNDLMALANKGNTFPKVQLDLIKSSTREKFGEYTMLDVKITSYTFSGTTEDTIPIETITITYAKLEMMYQPDRSKPAVNHKFDINSKCKKA